MAKKRISTKPRRPSTGASLADWIEYEKKLKQYAEERTKKQEIRDRIATFRRQNKI